MKIKMIIALIVAVSFFATSVMAQDAPMKAPKNTKATTAKMTNKKMASDKKMPATKKAPKKGKTTKAKAAKASKKTTAAPAPAK